MIVSQELRKRISAGELIFDDAQMKAAQELDNLQVRLKTTRSKPWFFSRKTSKPKGLYLWGGVGRGKSMLMDWFYETTPVSAKQRVHFHAFMLDVHQRITHYRKSKEGDPIKPVAEDIAETAKLLCFDEFHDLYKNGLNRALFEPFIKMMSEHLIIHEFSGDTDHRLRQLTAAPVYYSPLGAESEAALDAAWQRLTGAAKGRETVLKVQGRDLVLKQTAAGVARTSFNRLCAQPLGAADYLRLSHAFQTLILEKVPQMGPEKRNEAKRFVTLIDALYETRTKLIMSAEVVPHELYKGGDGSFEFERTASRLVEMRSADYLGMRRILEASA